MPTQPPGYLPKEDDSMLKKIFLNAMASTLHKAAQAGDAKKVRALIAKGHDVNGLDANKTSPLFWAAFSKDPDVARALVEHGADVNFIGPHGTTPLYNALHKRNEELALWLLDKGANPLSSDTNGNTMLHLASLQGMVSVVDILLTRGADVNALNANGQSPLTVNLIVQETLSPISASPVCILRLLEAGARYDPVPWLDLSLGDFLADRASANSAFREELEEFSRKTRDDGLRNFVEAVLQRAKPENSADKASPGGTDSLLGYADLQRLEKRNREPRTLQSSVLGVMTREEYDFWISPPLAIPFWNNETVAVTYDFDPDEDAGFMAEADSALAAFLKLNDAFRLSLSGQVAEFAKLNIDAWDHDGYEAADEGKWVGLRDLSINGKWLDDFVEGKKKAEDVWRMVGSPLDVYVARNSRDKAIYVAMRWNCLWDVEHKFQLSFKEGRTLARISAWDGDLTD